MKKNEYGIKHEPPVIIGKVPKLYTWLSEDKHCDVCVIGGGLTGAMCALTAAEMGLGVVLITSGAVGFGSTAHMLGCARFDCGHTLSELDKVVSIDDALKLYSLGLEALDGLQNLCGLLDGEYKKTGVATGFERRDSLVFTADSTELELMEREYLAMSKQFPDCTFISRKTADNSFDFPICGGILTKEGGAVLDPYGLTHLCLMKAEELGAEIFEQTEALDIQTPNRPEGCVIIKTSTHRIVYADKLIFSLGSDGFDFISRRARTFRSYTVITDADGNKPAWSGKCLLRTFGNRPISCVIRGNGEIAASAVYKYRGIHRFAPNAENHEKYDRLCGFIKDTLNDEQAPKIRYQYAYPYHLSPDGLPLIGVHQEYKNCLFALCGGADSPIYSQTAAESVREILSGNASASGRLFDPMRI